MVLFLLVLIDDRDHGSDKVIWETTALARVSDPNGRHPHQRSYHSVAFGGSETPASTRRCGAFLLTDTRPDAAREFVRIASIEMAYFENNSSTYLLVSVIQKQEARFNLVDIWVE